VCGEAVESKQIKSGACTSGGKYITDHAERQAIGENFRVFQAGGYWLWKGIDAHVLHKVISDVQQQAIAT
jgi:hypothetical protein